MLWAQNKKPILYWKPRLLKHLIEKKNICVGYDVIAQAQSGTGKTATFAIAILQQIDIELKATQAMVLAPTRELAQQVSLSPQ